MASNLQTLRVAKGISLTDLARQASVSVSYISKIESGAFPLTSTLINRLCQLLDCAHSDFEEPDKSSPYDFQEHDVTFRNNQLLSIHKWYPYIEGFSESFVKGILEKHPGASLVYDPFNGSGTTMLTASYLGYKVIATELNPFMQFVANVKVNAVKAIVTHKSKLSCLLEARDSFTCFTDDNFPKVLVSKYINDCYIDAGFFAHIALEKIAAIKSLIQGIRDKDVQDILSLCLSSILVEVSTMIRAADLRKRKPTEFNCGEQRVFLLFNDKLASIVSDILAVKDANIADAMIVADNAKIPMPDWENMVDIIITSPPYINGTNYFRNTKIELWILDFITSPKDLRKFRSEAITAGINDVSKDIALPRRFDFVETYALQVDKVSPDKRIPAMIRSYFSDMSIVFENLYRTLKPNGKLCFDIGDSMYYGVHIPADDIIERIAEDCGFSLAQSLVTRNRKSKKGTTLNQKLMIFEKPVTVSLRNAIVSFGEELPYKSGVYAKRNWGSGMHSLCSYQGKLKPAIAYHLIKRFTSQGEVILDPFCGIGTIPLEACLSGRVGIGIDINPIAFANTLAKVKKLDMEKIMEELKMLEAHISTYAPSEYEMLQAGMKLPINNGRISEYYHNDTLQEILAARQYFRRISKDSPEQQFLFACMLHILHGNRPYALSKRSNNQTPLKPRADEDAIYKSVTAKLKEKAERMYKHLEYDDNFCVGETYFASIFSKPVENSSVNAIITSPPFANSTRFYSSNWLRLWFCGWESEDFAAERERFVDYQQEHNFNSVYTAILDYFSEVLMPSGLTIMHLGKTKKVNMLDRIRALVERDERFTFLGSAEESVSECNRHGIRDQGATTDHQFLFFRKR